jgi:hypothetical protein
VVRLIEMHAQTQAKILWMEMQRREDGSKESETERGRSRTTVSGLLLDILCTTRLTSPD